MNRLHSLTSASSKTAASITNIVTGRSSMAARIVFLRDVLLGFRSPPESCVERERQAFLKSGTIDEMCVLVEDPDEEKTAQDLSQASAKETHAS